MVIRRWSWLVLLFSMLGLVGGCTLFPVESGIGGGGEIDEQRVENIACETPEDCPEGSKWCDEEGGFCVGCYDSYSDCPVGKECDVTTGLCGCVETGELRCPCNPDGSCNPDDIGGDTRVCLDPDGHWECEENCTCQGLSSWDACDSCGNECAAKQRARASEISDDFQESLPARCTSGRPADGSYIATKGYEGPGAEKVINEVTLAFEGGKLFALDDFPCEETFPDKTTQYNGAEECKSLYRCGCCYFWLRPSASSSSGWALDASVSTLSINASLCEYTLGGSDYAIGGEREPPAQNPDEVPSGCSSSSGCCNLCSETCSYCDSIRDLECFKQCYGECRKCCSQCP